MSMPSTCGGILLDPSVYLYFLTIYKTLFSTFYDWYRQFILRKYTTSLSNWHIVLYIVVFIVVWETISAQSYQVSDDSRWKRENGSF